MALIPMVVEQTSRGEGAYDGAHLVEGSVEAKRLAPPPRGNRCAAGDGACPDRRDRSEGARRRRAA